MESFDIDAALLAQFSEFDPLMLTVTTTFGSIEANLGIDQGWNADSKGNKGNKFNLVGHCEALAMTLRDQVEDVDNAARSGPFRRFDFLQSTGNSTNNSGAMIRQHTLKEKALKNIHLINKNYTLENTLHDTQKMVASIVAQNKLLQDKLAALNLSSSVRAPILSDVQALQVQQQTTGVLPASAGAVPDESMANDNLPMPIHGGGVLPCDTDASDGNT